VGQFEKPMKKNKSQTSKSNADSGSLEKRLARLERRTRRLDRETEDIRHPVYDPLRLEPKVYSQPMQVKVDADGIMSPECKALCKSIVTCGATLPPAIVPAFTNGVAFDGSTAPTQYHDLAPPQAGVVLAGSKTLTFKVNASGNGALAIFPNYCGLRAHGIWKTAATTYTGTTAFPTSYTTASTTEFQASEPILPGAADPFDGPTLNTSSGPRIKVRGVCMRCNVTIDGTTAAANTRSGLIHVGDGLLNDYDWSDGAGNDGTGGAIDIQNCTRWRSYDATFFDNHDDIFAAGQATAVNCTLGAVATGTSVQAAKSPYIAIWFRGVVANSEFTIRISSAYFAHGTYVAPTVVPKVLASADWANAHNCILYGQGNSSSHTGSERNKVLRKANDKMEQNAMMQAPSVYTQLALEAGRLGKWTLERLAQWGMALFLK